MNGINIQYPWSKLLIDQEKCVETRSYPLPKKYIGVELALIETPGRKEKFKSNIIGTITFSHSFKYETIYDFESDFNRHLVPVDDKNYGWKNDKDKYGWVVCNINKFDESIKLNSIGGIVFRKNVL
jgi:hypothetical protein